MPRAAEFDPRLLPILGVVWEEFPTMTKAERFARWAERTTRHHEYPCESTITAEKDIGGNLRYIVKVSNW